jgi:predicted metal-dependent hydrolase
VPPGKLQLTVPSRLSAKDLGHTLAVHQKHILQRLQILKKAAAYWQDQRNSKLLFSGAWYPLEIKSYLDIPSPTLHFDSRKFHYRFSVQHPEHQHNDMLAQVLAQWRQDYAKTAIPLLVQQLASEMNCQFAKVRIRNHRSLWGSCSTKKNVQLNWRIILLPQSIARYICVHELAHTLHHNHGKLFWQMVKRYDTNYITHRKWLRQYGWQFFVWG